MDSTNAVSLREEADFSNSRDRRNQPTTVDQSLLLDELDLAELFELDDAQFRARFRKTPFWRSRRRGLLRNAAIVLGNRGDEAAIDALAKGLQDPEPLVRGASAWALGQIGGQVSRAILARGLDGELDPQVQEEISATLGKH